MLNSTTLCKFIRKHVNNYYESNKTPLIQYISYRLDYLEPEKILCKKCFDLLSSTNKKDIYLCSRCSTIKKNIFMKQIYVYVQTPSYTIDSTPEQTTYIVRLVQTSHLKEDQFELHNDNYFSNGSYEFGIGKDLVPHPFIINLVKKFFDFDDIGYQYEYDQSTYDIKNFHTIMYQMEIHKNFNSEIKPSSYIKFFNKLINFII